MRGIRRSLSKIVIVEEGEPGNEAKPPPPPPPPPPHYCVPLSPAVGLAFQEECVPNPDVIKFFGGGEDDDEEDIGKMAMVGGQWDTSGTKFK